MFTSLHSSKNQELSEKHLCNQGSLYEKNTDNFYYTKEVTTKSMLFTVSKDKWNTKEDTGKSLKNALHILWYAKRHLSG